MRLKFINFHKKLHWLRIFFISPSYSVYVHTNICTYSLQLVTQATHIKVRQTILLYFTKNVFYISYITAIFESKLS